MGDFFRAWFGPKGLSSGNTYVENYEDFLGNWVVCVCVCIYIYIYIYLFYSNQLMRSF